MLSRQPNSAATAFAAYAAETRRHAEMMTDGTSTHVERSAQAHHMLVAERRWRSATDTAPTSTATRNRLACEGTLLLAALAALIGLLLPALAADFWPLGSAVLIIAALGGWTVHFAGRWAAYLRRIM